jgi:hypothetical protein
MHEDTTLTVGVPGISTLPVMGSGRGVHDCDLWTAFALGEGLRRVHADVTNDGEDSNRRDRDQPSSGGAHLKSPLADDWVSVMSFKQPENFCIFVIFSPGHGFGSVGCRQSRAHAVYKRRIERKTACAVLAVPPTFWSAIWAPFNDSIVEPHDHRIHESGYRTCFLGLATWNLSETEFYSRRDVRSPRPTSLRWPRALQPGRGLARLRHPGSRDAVQRRAYGITSCQSPPACPRCRAAVTEKTLVEWDG